ncbi:hypothetical protein CI238_10893 [Colletotrichum incanum]|uniref:Uncharacterized protein n=1 Tax=Colletotrichum incanum TaxID=1573173 RepID=A0A162NBB6_COLIC|nr:hypothetical protein CI238_10893 [Colletotrichum incanum]
MAAQSAKVESAKVESAKVDVFTEREYSDGRQAEFINQLFTLRIACYPPTLVYFRLSPKVDGVCDASIILQILPDHLALLRSELCRWDDVPSSHPDDARQRLGGTSDLTRLRFKLLSGMSAQIIVPKDSNGFETPDSAARHAIRLFASLASSPSFCVYFPRNKVQKSLLQQCVRAVPQFSGLNEDDLRDFRRKVDPKRLYGGKGGRVLTPDDYEDSSGTDGERSRSTTPATNPSNGSTVDFDSVPRPEGLPPQYGECLVEVGESRATSDDEANFVESPSVGHAPPEYDGTQSLCSVPNAAKRPRQYANEDALLCPRSKKILSATPSTTAPTRNVQCLDAKPRLESEGAGMDVCMVFRELTSRLDDQQQQIKQLLHEQSEQQLSQEQLKALQDQIGKLKRQNAELKRRNSELENTCAELTNRQETADEERESMWLDISELQEVTGEHGKQLADNPKLAEDLASFIWGDGFQGPVGEPMKEHLDDLVKEYLDRICEGDLIKLLRECVQKKVASQMDEMKARMCETFK